MHPLHYSATALSLALKPMLLATSVLMTLSGASGSHVLFTLAVLPGALLPPGDAGALHKDLLWRVADARGVGAGSLYPAGPAAA